MHYLPLNTFFSWQLFRLGQLPFLYFHFFVHPYTLLQKALSIVQSGCFRPVIFGSKSNFLWLKPLNYGLKDLKQAKIQYLTVEFINIFENEIRAKAECILQCVVMLYIKSIFFNSVFFDISVQDSRTVNDMNRILRNASV